MKVELTAEPLDGPVAAVLVDELVRELQVRYADDGASGAPLDPAAFAPPYGVFLVARRDGEPVGCGGVRAYGAGVGEVKRMYVAPAARGSGVGRRLLHGLEDAARGLGHERLLLETGTAQPEAIALYASAGWARVEPYGEWRDSPESVCFAQELG